MSEDKTISKPHLPKPDSLEDSGLDGDRLTYLAKAVLPAVCPSQAPVFEEAVKLCPRQTLVQKAHFGSKGENTSGTKVSTKSFSGKGEVRGRGEKEEAKKKKKKKFGIQKDRTPANKLKARIRKMKEIGSMQQTHHRCACTHGEAIPVE